MALNPCRAALSQVALAAACFAASAPAHALTILFNDVGTSPMSAAQLGAFQAAGAYWQSQLTDNVTVYVNIAFNNLPSNVLGSTDSSFTTTSYSSLRSALVADAKSGTDATAVASLQSGAALSFLATQGDKSIRQDSDGSTNNTVLNLTTANAKALGFNPGTNAANPDASIEFANAYAGSFAYTRSGGTPGNQVDFITVAEHEIGHALGFISGVDDIDYCLANPSAGYCSLSGAANEFENRSWYQPLDLFRYSAAGVLNLAVGGSPYFSVDGGATAITSFSTGAVSGLGDGYQASHFVAGVVTLMRPFVDNGHAYDATAADLAAFDAIGWDVATAVPEIPTFALMLAGVAAIGRLARRRSAVA